MKPHEIDVFALSVLRDFQKVEDAKETGRDSQLMCNVLEPDRLDRIHFDIAVTIHQIPSADFHMRPHPYADAARDFSITNAFA
jgi:hypothetical protein